MTMDLLVERGDAAEARLSVLADHFDGRVEAHRAARFANSKRTLDAGDGAFEQQVSEHWRSPCASASNS